MAGRKRGSSWLLAAAASAVVAIALVGVAMATVVLVRAMTHDGPTASASATGTCSAATWQVDLSWVTPAVVGHVTVFDGERRTWAVRWGDYASDARIPVTGSHGSVGFASALLGDTDDGSDRTVAIRPSGERDWCSLAVGPR